MHRIRWILSFLLVALAITSCNRSLPTSALPEAIIDEWVWETDIGVPTVVTFFEDGTATLGWVPSNNPEAKDAESGVDYFNGEYKWVDDNRIHLVFDTPDDSIWDDVYEVSITGDKLTLTDSEGIITVHRRT